MDHRKRLLVIALAFGVVFGAVVQKYWGFGRLLVMTGLSGSTVQASSTADSRATSQQLSVIPSELVGQVQLFILAGQSNMSGSSPLPAQQETHPRIFVFGNDYRWRIGQEPVDGDTGQVDPVSRDRQAGIGPGMAFALSLMKLRPEMAIGLVPCAKGASEIKQWQRNLGDDALYGSCLKRIRAASTMGIPAGLLFFQGEADAADPAQAPGRSPAAAKYAEKFTDFVASFRKDLAVPLPVVFAQIGSHTAPGYFTNWQLVKDQQESVSFPCTAMIKTDDLPLMDAVHYTTDSYRTIGSRFADAFTKLSDRRDEC